MLHIRLRIETEEREKNLSQKPDKTPAIPQDPLCVGCVFIVFDNCRVRVSGRRMGQTLTLEEKARNEESRLIKEGGGKTFDAKDVIFRTQEPLGVRSSASGITVQLMEDIAKRLKKSACNQCGQH